jgi:hypothetical protein
MAAQDRLLPAGVVKTRMQTMALFRWTKVAPPLESEVRQEVVPGSSELRGRDEWQLRHLLDAVPEDVGLTLDLTELDGITEDGCQALRHFGGEVALQRRKFRILYPLGGEVADALRETGTLDDPLIEFGEGGTAQLG